MAPQTTTSVMITELNECLPKTGSTKTKHYNLHESKIYYMTVVSDYFNFSWEYLINWQQEFRDSSMAPSDKKQGEI